MAGWLMLLQYLTSPDMVLHHGRRGAEHLCAADSGMGLVSYLPRLRLRRRVTRHERCSSTASRSSSSSSCSACSSCSAWSTSSDTPRRAVSLTALFNPNTFSVSGVMGAASLAVFSFVGFDALPRSPTAKDERHGPSRAMMIMVIILVAIFVLTCFIATCVDPSGQICKNDENNGFYHIAELVGGKWFGVVCAVSVAFGSGRLHRLGCDGVGIAHSLRHGQERIASRRLGQDRRERQVPIVATCFVSALSLVLLAPFLLIGMEGLGKVVNFGALSTYFLLNLCVVVWFWFRKKDHGNPVRFSGLSHLGHDRGLRPAAFA